MRHFSLDYSEMLVCVCCQKLSLNLHVKGKKEKKERMEGFFSSFDQDLWASIQ